MRKGLDGEMVPKLRVFVLSGNVFLAHMQLLPWVVGGGEPQDPVVGQEGILVARHCDLPGSESGTSGTW